MYLFLLLDTETQTCLLYAHLVRVARLPTRPKINILAEQQGHRCCYCGKPFIDPPPELINRRQQQRWFERLRQQSGDERRRRLPTIDHIIPRAQGGETIWENEVAACYDCNTKRGVIDAIEFYDNREVIIARMKAHRLEHRRQKRRARKRLKKVVVTAVGIAPTTSAMSRRHSAG